MSEHKITTALSLVIALGAYCPKVKIHDEFVFEQQQLKAKRRTRPYFNRGNYGANLMAHFDSKRQKEKKK